MKVYIVTAGSYSDYHIKRIFLDKSKAEHYAKGVYDVNEIEEYEIEDRIPELFTIISATLSSDNDYYFTVTTDNILDVPNPESKIRSEYRGNYTNRLWIQRIILKPKLYGDEILKLNQKYKKICLDLKAKIESLIQIEGWTEEMIRKWLEDKNIEAVGEVIPVPKHLCPNCKAEMKIVIKREDERPIVIDKLVCFNCKKEIITGKRFDFRRQDEL
jgi:hypothetical protein